MRTWRRESISSKTSTPCLHTVESGCCLSAGAARRARERLTTTTGPRCCVMRGWSASTKPATSIAKAGGFFRGFASAKGIGVVDRDGEDDLARYRHRDGAASRGARRVDDLRELAVQVGVDAGARSCSARRSRVHPLHHGSHVDRGLHGGEFAMLSQATASRSASAIASRVATPCFSVLENGRFVEGRYSLAMAAIR